MQFHTNNVRSACEKKLDITFKSGKEFNGWYKFEDKKIARITIPKGHKPIPPKTYKSMACQLKMTVNEFDDFLECTLRHPQYIQILKSQNAI